MMEVQSDKSMDLVVVDSEGKKVKHTKKKRTKSDGSSTSKKKESRRKALKRSASLNKMKFTKVVEEEDFSCSSESTMMETNIQESKKAQSDVVSLLSRVSTSSSAGRDKKALKDDTARANNEDPPKRKIKRKKSSRSKLHRSSSMTSLVKPDVHRQLKRSSSSRRLTKPKKAVSFKLSKKGSVKKEVCEFQRYSSDEIADVFFTAEELRSFRQDCLRVVGFFKKQRDYQGALQVLSQSHKSSVSQDQVEEACRLLLKHDAARGLEMHISETASSDVETYQYLLLEAAFNPKATSSSLRKESKPMTKASRHFATVLAEYDAQEAAVAHAC